MGKIRVKALGDENQENIQKKADEKRRGTKKEKKVTKLKGKGGGRINDLSQDEIVTPQLEEVPAEKAKSKKAKGPRPRGKLYKQKLKLVDKSKQYSYKDAVKLVKETSFSKFIGSVEIKINMKEKGLRGTVTLPHGTGKKITIAIANDQIIEQISSGKINFDILVAHPKDMGKLAKVARILGPKGLMPNPKAGTISPEPEKVVEKLSKGQIQWKTETEAPIIHMIIGKTDFENTKLEENLKELVKAIGPERINSVFLKATMGPAIKVNIQ